MVGSSGTKRAATLNSRRARFGSSVLSSTLPCCSVEVSNQRLRVRRVRLTRRMRSSRTFIQRARLVGSVSPAM